MLHIRLKITCDDILHNGTHITHNILDICYNILQFAVLCDVRPSDVIHTKHHPCEVIRARVSLRNLANYTIPINTGPF